MTAIAERDETALLEKVLIGGDLAALAPAERLAYYRQVCESLGLNPLTRPFEYLELNNKLTLYALRTTTDQLRSIHGVSVAVVSREVVNDVYVVTARATMQDGRTDESVGAVPLVKEGGEWKSAQGSGRRYFAGNGTFTPLPPEDRANAMMKAETKAKRRVTLSIVGLGWLDETEVESIAGAQKVAVTDAGEIEDVQQGQIPAPTVTPPKPRTEANRPTRFWQAAMEHCPAGLRYQIWGAQWLKDHYGAEDFSKLDTDEQDRAVAEMEAYTDPSV